MSRYSSTRRPPSQSPSPDRSRRRNGDFTSEYSPPRFNVAPMAFGGGDNLKINSLEICESDASSESRFAEQIFSVDGPVSIPEQLSPSYDNFTPCKSTTVSPLRKLGSVDSCPNSAQDSYDARGKGRGNKIATNCLQGGDIRAPCLGLFGKGRGRTMEHANEKKAPPGYENHDTTEPFVPSPYKDVDDKLELSSDACCVFEPPEKYRDVVRISNGSPMQLFDKQNEYYWELRKDKFNGRTYIDTHCHLDVLFFRENNFKGTYAEYKVLRQSSWSAAYEGCITDFCYPHTFAANMALWNKLREEPDVYAAFGCHPHVAKSYTDDVEKFLEARALDEKVVAIGEMGLDYSRNNNQDHDVQKDAFKRQLKLAIRTSKPLLIHCRDAEDDCFEIMQEIVPHDYPIHRHCFTGDWKCASTWTDYFTELKIGLVPAVLTPRPYQMRILKEFPLERIIIETDSPYFLPRFCHQSEFGGLEVNHPGMAYVVAVKLAHERQMDAAEVLRAIRQNTRQLYGI